MFLVVFSGDLQKSTAELAFDKIGRREPPRRLDKGCVYDIQLSENLAQGQISA